MRARQGMAEDDLAGSGPERRRVGRGAEKLAYALDTLSLDVTGWVTADFGCSVGGFTDCLLRRGASRVYAVDTAYGVLAWGLRQDPRVVVLERTNAMRVALPEPVQLVVVDVGWTPQRRILSNALRQLTTVGTVLSLFKPQYEAPADQVRRGRVSEATFEEALARCRENLSAMGIPVHNVVRLPMDRRRNPEAFLRVLRNECTGSDEAAPPGR